jgi:hypothetical protein
VAGINVTFTFSAGNAHVKAGKFVKHFKFNDESETLECVPTPAKEQPFVKADQISKDSFFYTWFNSEGEDDGILAAQEALGSELYLDPIAVRHAHAHAHATHTSRAGTGQPLHSDGSLTLFRLFFSSFSVFLFFPV